MLSPMLGKPKRFFISLLYMSLGLLLLPVQAQTATWVAFINSSGQLVAASADGNGRWIVTNPGETLHPQVGYAWSPEGDALFFAVQTSAGISLRIGDVNTQTAREIALENGALSGSDWTEWGILIANDSALRFYQTDGSVAELPSSQVVTQISRVLWSDAALVAYSALDENNTSLLVVTATDGSSIRLSSGRSTPLTPVAWLEGTTQLLYYGADYQIQWADVGCVFSGCDTNPLENGIVVLPASAVEVQIGQDRLFFREDETIRGVRLACVATDTCLTDAFTLATTAVSEALLSLQGDMLVYTTYSQDAFNPSDRTIWWVDATCAPDCVAQPLLTSAVNGALSPDGTLLIADIVGDGLYLITLADGRQLMLSGSGAALMAARWNG